MHLVLDLDETLISVSMSPLASYDFKFILQGITYYGKKRPGIELFLTYVFKRFQSVSVWTAATREYARRILNFIMTAEQRNKLAFFKTRKDLTASTNGSYKELNKMFESPQAIQLGLTRDNTIMIDDRMDVLRANPGNGILIPPWKGTADDKYLPKLLIILDGVLHHRLGFGHFGKVIDLRHLVD